MSWPQVLGWHLLPGTALLISSLLGGALFAQLDLPRIWGLLTAVLLVQVPLLLILTRRLPPMPREPRAAPLRPIVMLAVTLVLALTLPGVFAWAESAVRATVFGWLPDWWSAGVPALSSLTPVEQIVTCALWLAGPVLLGPIVEERFFRGALLPRIPAGPWLAAVVNAALFAAYHLWQPYTVVTVFLFALPIAVARSRYRASATVCATVHCLVNLGAFVALLAGVATAR